MIDDDVGHACTPTRRRRGREVTGVPAVRAMLPPLLPGARRPPRRSLCRVLLSTGRRSFGRLNHRFCISALACICLAQMHVCCQRAARACLTVASTMVGTLGLFQAGHPVAGCVSSGCIRWAEVALVLIKKGMENGMSASVCKEVPGIFKIMKSAIHCAVGVSYSSLLFQFCSLRLCHLHSTATRYVRSRVNRHRSTPPSGSSRFSYA